MGRKILVDEDDLKKVVLILHYSQKAVKLDPKDLALNNLWRISRKLSIKFLRRMGLKLVDKGNRKIFEEEIPCK